MGSYDIFLNLRQASVCGFKQHGPHLIKSDYRLHFFVAKKLNEYSPEW